MNLNQYAWRLMERELEKYYWGKIMDDLNLDGKNKQSHDKVNHPKHYTSHKSGIEAIQICEHMNFNLGNALKYIWRADLKGEAIDDLRKAVWYVNREIEKRINNDRI